MTRIFLLALSLFIASCNPPCCVNDLFGADEFVLDSYKIREGKLAILEMKQVAIEELDETLLEGDDSNRLYDVVNSLGLPINANLYKSYVVRGEKTLPVDFVKLMCEKDKEQNIVLHVGDQIYLDEPHYAKVTFLGDGVKSCTIALPSGKMSLKEALGEAGGLLDPRASIQVIRGAMARPKIYTLHLNHILHLPNESLLVMDGDTVYISRKPLTREGLSAYDGLYR